MDRVSGFSTDHCLILAAHYASNAEIPSLRTLTRSRSNAFSTELIFQVLLTYLPESAEPSIYVEYLYEVASGNTEEGEQASELDISPVSELSDSQARKRGRKIHLLPLAHPSCPRDEIEDSLTLFLIHRSYRIDSETGLLNLVPELLLPFLDHSEYLNTWFISSVLPLVRLQYEYHPEAKDPPTLADFDGLAGRKAVETLLRPVVEAQNATPGSAGKDVANDIKDIVGPWMYGDSQRKRRRLNTHRRSSSSVSLNGTGASSDVPQHDWDYIFEWMLRKAERDFTMVAGAIDNWDGPEDVDFGGYAEEQAYLPEAMQSTLELRYAQTAMATVYGADTAGLTKSTIENAHGVLTRLLHFMDSLGTLPELDADINSFPSLVEEALPMRHLPTAILQQDALLKPDHVLTTPKPESFSLVATLVYSCRLLAELGYETSIIESTRLWLRNDSKEQLAIVQAILHGLQNGSKRSDSKWLTIRGQLLWLWTWGIKMQRDADFGAGLFGGLGLETLEKEILSTLLMCGCKLLSLTNFIILVFTDTWLGYQLVLDTYIRSPTPDQCLSSSEIEDVVLKTAFHHYDNASNGNRTRGGMKKASDTYVLKFN
jgi:protein transport protein SEC39